MTADADKERVNWVKRSLILFLLTTVFASLLAAYHLLRYFSSEITLPEQGLDFVIEPGRSIGQVARRLDRQGVLEDASFLIAYARLSNRVDIKAGEYTLKKPLTPLTLLALFRKGEVKTYQVTLLEGWTFQQALDHLHTQSQLRAKLKGQSQNQMAELLSLGESRLSLGEGGLEGLFFPDTYHFVRGNSDVSILLQARRALEKILMSEWEERAENLPYSDPYEALIMASIVERESGAVSEGEKIAGVFVRRLQKNMRLQTDPTVIYGLGDEYTGNLRRKHLKQASPYNTYLIKGLPPTPIAMPGRAAIHAALHPEAGSALYFVAKGDGSHYFSDNLAQHNAAVRKYQIYQRKKNYRSAPGS